LAGAKFSREWENRSDNSEFAPDFNGGCVLFRISKDFGEQDHPWIVLFGANYVPIIVCTTFSAISLNVMTAGCICTCIGSFFSLRYTWFPTRSPGAIDKHFGGMIYTYRVMNV
jgi:hypothetical protein